MFTKLTKLTSLIALASAIAACSADAGTGDDFGGGAKLEPVTMPEHEAALVVQFVNDPATTVDLLDTDVGIDRRAAQNIIAHRNGPDGVYPSADDDPFDDLEELDAIPYVGEWAMAEIHDWAITHPPAQAEHVEGVQFTSHEAAAVIWGVNHASLPELDDEVGLVRQAAENLIANAPYASVTEMGAVPYVGAAALTALRNHALVWSAEMGQGGEVSQAGTYDGVSFDQQTAEIALSIANTASYEQLTGNGVNSSGAHAIVDSRPHSTLAHVADSYGVGPATMRSLHDYASSGQF